jgi:hypothetical protein
MALGDRERILNNLALACQLLAVTSPIVIACSIIRYYSEEILGYLLSLIGALLYFGAPIPLAQYMSSTSPEAQQAVANIIAGLRTAGFLAFVPGVMLVVIDLIRRIVHSMTKPRVAAGAVVWGKEENKSLSVKQRIYGNCWELPHCREFVRRLCPAYLAKTSCWRLKSGCYCDERTILKAMQSKGNELVKNAQFSHGVAASRAVSPAQKRARCRRCAIYLEHQRQKYRIISPLVFPAVVIGLWVISPNIQGWLQTAIQYTDHFMRFVSFNPQNLSGPGGWANQLTGSAAIQWMFIVWLGIMAISYTLQLVEYFIFKVQI